MVELLRNRVPRRGRGKRGLDAAHLRVFSLLHRVPFYVLVIRVWGFWSWAFADSHMI